MSVQEPLRKILNRLRGRLISFGELVMPDSQKAQAFRKLILDELGMDGLEGDLQRILDGGSGKDGTGRNRRSMKGGALMSGRPDPDED